MMNRNVEQNIGLRPHFSPIIMMKMPLWFEEEMNTVKNMNNNVRQKTGLRPQFSVGGSNGTGTSNRISGSVPIITVPIIIFYEYKLTFC